MAIWLTDESRSTRPTQIMRITLDRVVTDTASVTELVSERMSVDSISVTIDDVDFVRETTRVSVRYAVDDSWWSWADAQRSSDRIDAAESEAADVR